MHGALINIGWTYNGGISMYLCTLYGAARIRYVHVPPEELAMFSSGRQK